MPKGISPYHQGAGVSLAERLAFHSIPEPNSGCLLWTGVYVGKGYGHMFWKGMMQRSHRLAWINAHGPIPPGMVVCHRCDVPACINPDHLFLGTHADNVADRHAKGRTVGPWKKQRRKTT